MRGLLVGCGRMGANHKRVLESLGHHVTTVDPVGGRYAAIEDAPDADFACIATPPENLATSATRTLERGIPTLIEKPMATSVTTAASLARDPGAPLAVGYVEWFNPAVRALTENLYQIGAIRHLSAQRLSPHPNRELHSVALDLATHEIHTAVRICGEVTNLSVQNTDDHYSAIARFRNGATASIEASWLSPVKVRTLRVVGTEGTLELDYRRQTLHLQAAGAIQEIDVRPAESLALQWRSFLTNFEPEVSGRDGLAVLQVIDHQE